MGEESAHFVSGFEHGDTIPHVSEIKGSRQSRRARTDDGHLVGVQVYVPTRRLEFELRLLDMVDEASL